MFNDLIVKKEIKKNLYISFQKCNICGRRRYIKHPPSMDTEKKVREYVKTEEGSKHNNFPCKGKYEIVKIETCEN